VRGDLLIEIQTRNLSAIRGKLAKLLTTHAVRVVYPISQEKWIVRLADDERSQLGRRRSPKRQAIEDLFEELVAIPKLFTNPRFSLEVLLIQEDEVRRRDPRRGRRRKGWTVHERRLVGVVEHRLLSTPADVADLIPPGLPSVFTTSHLAKASDRPLWLAQKMAYCLRQMGVIKSVGKCGNSLVYRRVRG